MAEFQDYFGTPIAYNPATEELVADAQFTVHATDDVALANPLRLFDPTSGVEITGLKASNIGVLPDFRVEGNPTQVIIKSGSFTTKLTSVYGAVVTAGLDPATVQAAITAGANAVAAGTQANAAAAAASESEQAAAGHAAAVQAVQATNDAIMTSVAADTGSTFATQLNATIGEQSRRTFGRRADAMSSPRVPLRPDAHDESWIATFSGAHGWTWNSAGAGITSFPDTQDPRFGSALAQFGPAQPSTNVELNSPQNMGLNLDGRALVVYLEAKSAYNQEIRVLIGNDNAFATHSYFVINASDYPSDGGVTAVKIDLTARVGPTSSGADLTSINRIRLTFTPPTGSALVRVLGISSIHDASRPTFVIGFDDSPGGVMDLALPVLRSAHFPAMIYAIGEASDDPSNPLSADAMHQLEEVDGWEIGGHAATYAEHVDLRTLSEPALDDAMYRIKRWLTGNGFRGHHFAYPHGFNNELVRRVTSRYFSTGRTVSGGAQIPDAKQVLAPTHRPFNLPSPSYDESQTPLAFTKAAALSSIARANQYGLTFVMTFHTVVRSGAGAGGAIDIADLEDIVEAIEGTGGRVTTLSGLYGL